MTMFPRARAAALTQAFKTARPAARIWGAALATIDRLEELGSDREWQQAIVAAKQLLMAEVEAARGKAFSTAAVTLTVPVAVDAGILSSKRELAEAIRKIASPEIREGLREARPGEPIVPMAQVRALVRAILDIGRRYR